MIRPLTLTLLCYGPKSNVSNIERRARSFLKEEVEAIDEAWFESVSATAVHEQIVAEHWDHTTSFKAPTSSQVGARISLVEVNERMVGEWLEDLPVAKTCVVFVSWQNPNQDSAHQYVIKDGAHWHESREH